MRPGRRTPTDSRPEVARAIAAATFTMVLAACSTPAPIVVSRPVDLPPVVSDPPAPTAAIEVPPPRPVRPRPAKRRPGRYFRDDGPGDHPPPGLAAVPDAVPRAERVSVTANQPYMVFGRRYVPMTRLSPYRQRGIASWYGRKFHGRPTASGERYDMYGMTAAHPTLPLPCFVRVTSVATGRSVVVRVNDRGPFLNGRAIDLSYTAAFKLGYAQSGSTEVELELVMVGDFPGPGSAPAPIATARADPLVKGLVQAVGERDDRWLSIASYGTSEQGFGALGRLERELDLPRGALALAFDGRRFRVQWGPFEDDAQLEAARTALRDRLAGEDGPGSGD